MMRAKDSKFLIPDYMSAKTDDATIERQCQQLLYSFSINPGFRLVQDAFNLMRDSHGDARRENGDLYISHPLRMYFHANALGIYSVEDVALLAAILLHDVPEDCHVSIQSVSDSSLVRNIVRSMTIQQQTALMQTKAEIKRSYFENMAECSEAIVCKLLDRSDNLWQMTEDFPRERVLKNWRETYHLLLPVSKRAKSRCRYTNQIVALREDLKKILFFQQKIFQFTEEEMFAPYGTMDFEQRVVPHADPTLPTADK